MQRRGGRGPVRVLATGTTDVLGAVTALTARDGPAPLEVVGVPTGATTLAELAALVADAGLDVDVALIGLAGDLDTPLDELEATATTLVRRLRDDLDVHVLVVNVSTWSPDARSGDLRAARLDVLAIELSAAEGVSVVDVDRLVAELGAAGHVAGPGAHDAVVDGLVAAEVVRVLADYGFFEDRPLVAQVGQEDVA